MRKMPECASIRDGINDQKRVHRTRTFLFNCFWWFTVVHPMWNWTRKNHVTSENNNDYQQSSTQDRNDDNLKTCFFSYSVRCWGVLTPTTINDKRLFLSFSDGLFAVDNQLFLYICFHRLPLPSFDPMREANGGKSAHANRLSGLSVWVFV